MLVGVVGSGGTVVVNLGMRWKIEENNAQGKDLLGLDQYQVRAGWWSWSTASMAFVAFCAVAAHVGDADVEQRTNGRAVNIPDPFNPEQVAS
jgi:SRSO17 transposase